MPFSGVEMGLMKIIVQGVWVSIDGTLDSF